MSAKSFGDADMVELLSFVRNKDAVTLVWTGKTPVEVKPVLEMAAALICDKPLFVLLQKGQVLPASVRRIAAGIEEYSADDDESFHAAAMRMLDKGAELLAAAKA